MLNILYLNIYFRFYKHHQSQKVDYLFLNKNLLNQYWHLFKHQYFINFLLLSRYYRLNQAYFKLKYINIKNFHKIYSNIIP